MLQVVGNVAIDTVFTVDRFPLPGETIVAAAMVEDIGGKGANQAVVAARAGVPVRLVAAVGDDEAARLIRSALQAEGVLGDGLCTIAGPTDRSSIYVDGRGENTIVSLIGAARTFDPLALGALDGLAPGDTVLCQGNLRPEVLTACLAKARQAGARTALNPSPVFPAEGFDWRLADLLVLNRVEVQQIAAHKDPRAGARNSKRPAPVRSWSRSAAKALCCSARKSMAYRRRPSMPSTPPGQEMSSAAYWWRCGSTDGSGRMR